LLRKRGPLVHQRTANLLSIQSLISRTTGNSISAKYIKALDIQHVDGVLPNPDLVLALKANLAVMNSADAQIEILEKAVQDRVKLRPQFRFLKTVPGIGPILALTIMSDPVQASSSRPSTARRRCTSFSSAQPGTPPSTHDR
jgi:transposase